MTAPTIGRDQITLLRGGHDHIEGGCGACYWEIVNLLKGHLRPDGTLTIRRPPGVSPVLYWYSLSLNDRLNDTQRQALRKYLPAPDGTFAFDSTDDGHDEARAWMLADWTARTALPAWLGHPGRDAPHPPRRPMTGEHAMRTIDPANIKLLTGSHPAPPEGCDDPEACFWEWYNWLLGERLTDNRPPGISLVLYRYAMSLNDRLDDTHRQELKRFLPDADGHSPLDGTANDGHDQQRLWMLADWVTRTAAPAWLELAALTGQARAMRALEPLVNEATAQVARELSRKVRQDAWEARGATYTALRAKVRKLYSPADTADAATTAAAAAAAAADAATADAVAAAAAATTAATTTAAADAAAGGVAVAAAAAAAADAAAADDPWSETYRRVYAKVKAAVEARLAPTRDELAVSAVALLEAMIHPDAP